MTFGVGTFGLALVAGLLTSASPCVLPLVPILMSSAVATHRLGPWALALGVAFSYAVVGGLLASVGASLALAGETFREVAAALGCRPFYKKALPTVSIATSRSATGAGI